jgi:hypothetical protein
VLVAAAALVLAAVGMARKLSRPAIAPQENPPSAIVPDGAAASQVMAQAPSPSPWPAPAPPIDPQRQGRLLGDLEALPRASAAWRGVPSEDYLAILSAVESTLCAPDGAIAGDALERVDRLRLRNEATALARYRRETGTLPPRVADSLVGFLRSGRPAFSPGAGGWATAGLAVGVSPDPRFVVDLVRENGALHRWRERPPLTGAPTGSAALCDRELLLQHLAPGPISDRLRRYRAATPVDVPLDRAGLLYTVFAPERDEAAGTLELRLRITNVGSRPLPLKLDAARLVGLDAAPLLTPTTTEAPPGAVREVTLRFVGVTDAVAEAAVLALEPGAELAVWSEDLR